MNQNLTVQDALADASGYRSEEVTLRRQAESTFVISRLRTAADSGVAGLRAFRRRRWTACSPRRRPAGGHRGSRLPGSVRDRSAESVAGGARRPPAHPLAAGLRRRFPGNVQHSRRDRTVPRRPCARSWVRTRPSRSPPRRGRCADRAPLVSLRAQRRTSLAMDEC